MLDTFRDRTDVSSGVEGTMRYLAPELLDAEKAGASYTKESDVWAFGMTVFVSTKQHEQPFRLD